MDTVNKIETILAQFLTLSDGKVTIHEQ